MENNNNDLIVFTGELGKFRMANINGKDYFVAKDIASSLGYSNPRDAISRHCKGVVKHDSFKDGGNMVSLIPEGDVYRLVARSKLPNADKFESWIFDDVIPSINKNGAYVSPNITEKQEEQLDKYSTNKKIRNTFNSCNIESIEQEFKECMIYHKNKDGKGKNGIQNTVINALNNRKQTLIDSGKGSFALVLAEVITTIGKKQLETNNKSKSQIISHKNKIIDKQLQIIDEKDEELNSLANTIAILNPSLSEYMCINSHGMSENYLYEKVVSDYTGKFITVKTNTYKNWIKNFPSQQLIPKSELNIDWSKPIIVYIKFDCLARFDKQNLLKSAFDQIITREYGEDDCIIDKIIVEKNLEVDNYKDGKIYCYIRNVD